MNHSHRYLIPDYLPLFSCKMGECRTPCCNGWPVSISLDDYFHLTSHECSEQLRRRLDTGVKIKLRPTPESYAEITPRYDGDCSLRLSDGRCLLHAELGEEALADVCRLYPRGIRVEPDYECSLTNSCEAVLELLYQKAEPITFRKEELDFGRIPKQTRLHTFPIPGDETELRLQLIACLQNRSKHLPERLLSLEKLLRSFYPAEASSIIPAEASSIIPAEASSIIPAEASSIISANVKPADLAENQTLPHRLSYGLSIMRELSLRLDAQSDSLRSFGEAALAYFTNNNGNRDSADNTKASSDEASYDDINFPYERYQHAKEHFETAFPDWERFFEHLLVNHIFFEQFPYQDRPESPQDEFLAIGTLYALLRFLCLGYMSDKTSVRELIDLTSTIFRLVEHTSFDSYVAHIMQELGCFSEQSMLALLSL